MTVTNIVPLRLQLLWSTMYGNFVNVYAHSGSKGEKGRKSLFTESLLDITQVTKPKPILIGDWNCLIRLEDKEGWSNHDQEPTKLSLELKQLISSGYYTDAFLCNNNQRIGYTWRRRGKKSSRLDRVYIPPHLMGNLRKPAEHHCHLSDHDAVVFSLHSPSLLIKNNSFQLNYWKLNKPY